MQIPVAGTTTFERIALARRILIDETQALQRLAGRLPADFDRAVDRLLELQGCLLVTGIGKAGWIGQKLSATFSSTGTRSHFVHPAEAIHGDYGKFGPDDLVLMLTNSGETEELVRMLDSIRRTCRGLIAITSSADNTVARAADLVLDYGKVTEACPLGLAPSTSTTVMLALGDALALVTAQARGFGPLDFAHLHPGGNLGRKLARVEDVMRPLERCRVARDDRAVRQIYVETAGPMRRSGAILLTDVDGRLSGIFTDSDLARLLETKHDDALDGPIAAVMTRSPMVAVRGDRLGSAVERLAQRSLSELPVVDADRRPVGMIDITDLLTLVPADEADGTV
ncbi:MAG TPA: KpsF/GutQ family sugar-phosphate isomerase [Pirellulaceae bacterium]|nr:KpsF/GutQ family sugar-phosphate isomerase [Pirellulaceae bacterium]